MVGCRLYRAGAMTQSLVAMLELTLSCTVQGEQKRGAYADQHEHDIS